MAMWGQSGAAARWQPPKDLKAIPMRGAAEKAPVARVIFDSVSKPEADVRELVLRALTVGFGGIATAGTAGNEHQVGAALADSKLPRERLWIQTAFAPPAVAAATPPSATQVGQSIAASLGALGTDYVDCLIMPELGANTEQTIGTWRAMEAAHKSGQVRRRNLVCCHPGQLFAQILGGVLGGGGGCWEIGVRAFSTLGHVFGLVASLTHPPPS